MLISLLSIVLKDSFPSGNRNCKLKSFSEVVSSTSLKRFILAIVSVSSELNKEAGDSCFSTSSLYINAAAWFTASP